MSARPCASSRSLRMSGDRSSRARRSNAQTKSLARSTRITPRLPDSASGLTTDGEGAVRRERRRIVGNRDVEKRRRQQTRGLEGAPARELVPARSNRRRRIAGQSERLGDAGGQNRRPIADRDDPVVDACRSQAAITASTDAASSQKRTGIARSDQGSLELIAPIAGKDDPHAELLGRLAKRSDLVARRRRQKQDVLHTRSICSGPGSAQQYHASVI